MLDQRGTIFTLVRTHESTIYKAIREKITKVFHFPIGISQSDEAPFHLRKIQRTRVQSENSRQKHFNHGSWILSVTAQNNFLTSPFIYIYIHIYMYSSLVHAARWKQKYFNNTRVARLYSRKKKKKIIITKTISWNIRCARRFISWRFAEPIIFHLARTNKSPSSRFHRYIYYTSLYIHFPRARQRRRAWRINIYFGESFLSDVSAALEKERDAV